MGDELLPKHSPSKYQRLVINRDQSIAYSWRLYGKEKLYWAIFEFCSMLGAIWFWTQKQNSINAESAMDRTNDASQWEDSSRWKNQTVSLLINAQPTTGRNKTPWHRSLQRIFARLFPVMLPSEIIPKSTFDWWSEEETTPRNK